MRRWTYRYIEVAVRVDDEDAPEKLTRLQNEATALIANAKWSDALAEGEPQVTNFQTRDEILEEG